MAVSQAVVPDATQCDSGDAGGHMLSHWELSYPA